MKLLIISNMAHYNRENRIVGHGPTAREINYLAQSFSEVRHLACLHPEAPRSIDLPYEASNIQLVPLPPAGGKRLSDKLGILLRTPIYLFAILREVLKADIVHVRCPANIPLIAIILLALIPKPQKRWIKYAGNWKPEGREALSYTIQRWWLKKNLARAIVTVNGNWADSPSHVYGFLNPCLTNSEINEGEAISEGKTLHSPVQLLFVGNVGQAKGVEYALKVVSHLKLKGASIHLDLVGDGPERAQFEVMTRKLAIDDEVTFHGWKSRDELNPLYARAHIMLFPSRGEGWPKVLSEAMAFGVVPVTSDVSSIPQYLKQFRTGHTFKPDDIEAYSQAIINYIEQPEVWKSESANSVEAARLFSYDAYLQSVHKLLRIG